MSDKLQILVAQMTSTDSSQANVEQIEFIVNQAKKNPKIAFFPENSLYMRLKEGESIVGIGLGDQIWDKLKKISQAKNIILHLGSIPLREGTKLSNASIVVYPDGNIECSYRKMHLFDISLEGEKPFRESDVFTHGTEPKIFTEGKWKFGQTICYDIRFAELYNFYAKRHVDAILVPAAFLVKTGQDHWEVLLRARAIESQCYVVASAQAGLHKNSKGESRATYGHSMVISPWGDVLVKGSADSIECIEFELDRSAIEKVRKQIPMATHRRLKE